MPLLLALLLTLACAGSAYAQAGFIQAVPGTARPLCTSITSPVVNQTWCATAEGAPGTYLWKVWNGTTYVTVGGGGGGGGNAIALNNQTWAAFPSQFFANDANLTITSAGGVHTLGMTGCIPVSRGGIGVCLGTQNAFPYFATPSSLAMSILHQTAPDELTVHPDSSVTQVLRSGHATGGAGGGFILKAGDADTASGADGGSISLLAGVPDAGGNGGFAEVGGTSGVLGGSVTIAGGHSSGGAGAFITIVPGDSTGGSGHGGDLFLIGGNNFGGGFRGGDVILTPGAGAPSGNVIINGLKYPLVDGTAGQAIVTDGAGTLSFASGGTGTVTGSGAATQIAVWTSGSNITGFTDFIWDEAKNTLAVGSGTSDTGVGQSILLGHDNTNDGNDVYVLGQFNANTGGGNLYTLGSNNTLDGASVTFVVGDNNDVTGCGSCSTVGNFNTLGSGGSNFAFGSLNDLSAGSGSGVLVGVSNVDASGGNTIQVGSSNTDSGGGGSTLVGVGNTNTHSNTMLVGYGLSSVANNALSLGVSAVPEVTVTANLVELGQIGSPSVVLQFDGSTSGSTSLKAGATPTPTTFILPTGDGANGDCLVTNGAGQLAFSNTCAGGGGITSLNGLSAAVQTVSPGSTNINWSSAVSTHTFTWTGQLSNVRGGTGQDSSAWSALPLVTAGTWSQYAGSTCPGGQAATSISASGVLTCSATGTGTVTHTGNLTAGVPVIGNGAADLKTFPSVLTNTAYYSNGSGVLASEALFNYFDSQHTLVLGVGALPGSAAWGAPKLFVAQLGEIGSASGATGPVLRLESTNGTFTAPTAVVNTNVLGTIDFRGYDGSSGVSGATIKTVVAAAPAPGIIPTNIVFETTNVTGVKQFPLTLRNNGNVIFGHKIIAYNGLGATDGSLLIGNAAGGAWDANTLTAGPGITINNGPGTIQISTTSPSQCAGGGRVVLTDSATDAVVTFGTPLANANYAMASSVIPGAGATVGFPVYVKNVTANGFTVVISAAPGAGKSTTVAWIATPSTCSF